MQNNNSVEEERQEQYHVEENEFDMINHIRARPEHGASTQRSQWQPLYIGQLDLHKKKVLFKGTTLWVVMRRLWMGVLSFTLSMRLKRGRAVQYWAIST